MKTVVVVVVVVVGGLLAVGVALQPRAGLAAVVLAGSLALVVRARYAGALLVVLVVVAQFGLRVDATAPRPVDVHPSRPHHR